MAKGFFTQGVALLLDRAPPLELVAAQLSRFSVQRLIPDDGKRSWMGGGATAVLSMPFPGNGVVLVDVLHAPWPDSMGGAKDPLFAAWTLGWFGPLTYPGNLKRALQQNHAWAEAPRVVPGHKVVVRVKSTHVAGGKPDALVFPADYDPERELSFVTQVALALSRLPGTLAFFNPGGELLMDPSALAATLKRNTSRQQPPLDAWSNVRLGRLPGDWLLMDSVGMDQLDVKDHEAIFPAAEFSPAEVAGFLRDITLYAFRKAAVFDDGSTADGPGDIRWQAQNREAICEPPRATIRWAPLGVAIPEAFR